MSRISSCTDATPHRRRGHWHVASGRAFGNRNVADINPAGLILVAVGLLWRWSGPLRLGRLPGDIVEEHQNFSFYFPITTGLLISAVLTLVLWLINR
jgi:hypothetical protein